MPCTPASFDPVDTPATEATEEEIPATEKSPAIEDAPTAEEKSQIDAVNNNEDAIAPINDQPTTSTPNAPAVDSATATSLSTDAATPTSADTIEREFTCMNDPNTPCMSGQYTMGFARKVISNHFGRNKACTRKITSWPNFCRKHYQRATYNPASWQIRKISLIQEQFGIIEAEHPGTTYNISLKKSEQARLSTYCQLSDQKEKTQEECEAAVAPNASNKAFQAPINVLREISYYLGPGRTKDEAINLVALILSMINQKECELVPSVEWLPEIPDQPSSSPVSEEQGDTSNNTGEASSSGSGKKRKATEDLEDDIPAKKSKN